MRVRKHGVEDKGRQLCQTVCGIQDQCTAVAENEEDKGNYVNPSLRSKSNVATAIAENRVISESLRIMSHQCMDSHTTVHCRQCLRQVNVM